MFSPCYGSLNLDDVQYLDIMHNTCSIYNTPSDSAVKTKCPYLELFYHLAAFFPVELISFNSVLVHKYNVIEFMFSQLEWTILFC